MSFWDFIKPPTPAKGAKAAKPATAAELAVALSEAAAEAAHAEGTAADIAERRAGMLLTADDATLDRIEHELRLAQRAADRTAAAVEVLRGRLAQAEEGERQGALNAVYSKGTLLLRNGVDLYQRYDKLARELAELVEQISDTDDAIRAVNAELAALGDPRSIADLDREARPRTGAEQGLALWLETEVASGTEANAYHWRLSASRNLEEVPPSRFHQEPHQPGVFRSTRPEAGA
jgi:hypothetical protein